MKLGQLLTGIDFYADKSLLDREVADIKINSLEIKEGDVFVALKGINHDGNHYFNDAFEKGAVAIISDEADGEDIVKVDDARVAYSLISKNFFGRACDELKIVAVTGTNGKTTTTSLISEILNGSGCKTGLIGTEGVKYNGKHIDTGFTTPDPYTLHKVFKQMKDEGIEYVVMEASAHAIALKKLAGVKFDVGVLTNITEDHLDYFGDMDTYAQTKLSFFNRENMTLGIVCADDDYAKYLFVEADVPILSYGIENPSDTFAINLKGDFDHTAFECNCLEEIFPIKTNLVGRYNVENTLAAITVCRALGLPAGLIQANLRYINAVEGRFNVVRCKGFNVVIDYAHTPDGLEKVINTAREMTKGRLIILFGCGGNRDRLKRKIMGKIASENSDKVYVTSDNPRYEKPMDIISEIEEGINCEHETIENREAAIIKALSDCEEGDTLIIAGKGGEKYQDIMGVKHPYNDFDVVHKFFRDQIVEIKGGEYEH